MMKKKYFKNIMLAICVLFSHALIAQDTVTVAPGLGTLEAAIALDGGSKIYKLTAGAYYGLTSIVQVSDSTMGAGNGLTIIGEESDYKIDL